MNLYFAGIIFQIILSFNEAYDALCGRLLFKSKRLNAKYRQPIKYFNTIKHTEIDAFSIENQNISIGDKLKLNFLMNGYIRIDKLFDSSYINDVLHPAAIESYKDNKLQVPISY